MSNQICESAFFYAAVRELEVQWAEVSRAWNDDVAADFCRSHLDPITETLLQYAQALRDLIEVLEVAEFE